MYVKLFSSLYQGTLRGRSDEILVFTNLLAHADQHGIVDKHWRAIADETGLSKDEVETAIKNLEAPDPESRSPENDGRRIILMDEHRAWGWKIVNYGKYRAIRNEDDRREQNRIAQEKWRNKQSKQNKPPKAQGEAEGEAFGGAPPSPPSTVASAPAAKSHGGNAKGNGKEKPTPPTRETWAAYKAAYLQRHGVEPVSNAKVNSQIKQFVERIGQDESPGVAAFFVGSNRGLYVSAKHPVNLLLRDAESLHTEWATNRHGTETEGRQADKTATIGNVFTKLIEESREAKKNGA